MDILLEALTSASANDRDVYRPEFFRLTNPLDRARMQEVLKSVPGIRVHDELHSQLTELVRSLDPSVKFTRPELDDAAVSHLGGIPAEHYGVWVFYPWSSRLVHLLDETEFALVRTDRNRNKITREEQAILSSKKIGVLGLSVGQSICLTLALERGFGELRIADFDTLELSNLNRIRSGVHSMGHLKTVNVAREIAELDPFLKVTLFNEGVSRDNIDRFLTEGGNLDMLVDECDSVDVKIFCRQKAKALRIPVIMDTSDRGMLDVERFDLEPERPILHGLIEHLNIDDATFNDVPNPERNLMLTMAIVQPAELSERMKISLPEIGKTICSWPQLAGDVIMGGGASAEMCRRIFLGHFRSSGRWYLDTERALGLLPDHKGPAAVVASKPEVHG
ncbi:MAG: ThiF family adenylyltransferase [Flavobacteriales bacterium]|nr:ThiF family adenylyltransferase [Flavobacteriales bacterium]